MMRCDREVDAIQFSKVMEYLLKSSLMEVTRESLNAGQTRVRKHPAMCKTVSYVLCLVINGSLKTAMVDSGKWPDTEQRRTEDRMLQERAEEADLGSKWHDDNVKNTKHGQSGVEMHLCKVLGHHSLNGRRHINNKSDSLKGLYAKCYFFFFVKIEATMVSLIAM